MRTRLSWRSAVCCLGLAIGPSHAAEPVAREIHANTLSAWRSPSGDWTPAQAVAVDPANSTRFSITLGTGVLVNGAEGRTVDLLTQAEFGDVEAHVEFCISDHSNSGVYLMGRYEVQIYDSHGVAKDLYPGIECGGVYPRWTEERGEFEGHSPRVNASKPAGQWQSFDITFRAPRFDADGRKTEPARFVRVVHNGQLVHENVVVNGPTRAARWDTEAPIGPLLIQGDHGPVAIRNITLRPVTAETPMHHEIRTDGYGDTARHDLRALAACPELALDDQKHPLRTSSVIQQIRYGDVAIDYARFDTDFTERFQNPWDRTP